MAVAQNDVGIDFEQYRVGKHGHIHCRIVDSARVNFSSSNLRLVQRGRQVRHSGRARWSLCPGSRVGGTAKIRRTAARRVSDRMAALMKETNQRGYKMGTEGVEDPSASLDRGGVTH